MNRPPAAQPGFVIYVMCNSVAATIEAVVAHGGEIVQPIGVDAPEITARFRDPGGNVIGLYPTFSKLIFYLTTETQRHGVLVFKNKLFVSLCLCVEIERSVLQRDAEALGHSVQRAAIDAEDFSGTGAAAAGGFQHVQHVAPSSSSSVGRPQTAARPAAPCGPASSAGRSDSSTRPDALKIASRSIVFSSSRTLPGQS